MIGEEVLDVVRRLLPVTLALPVDLGRVHADQPDAVHGSLGHRAVVAPADRQIGSDVDGVSVDDARHGADNAAQARAKCCDKQQREEQGKDD